MRNKSELSQPISQDPLNEELMVIELDERLEFSVAAFIDGNLACNTSGCTQNGSCGKKGS